MTIPPNNTTLAQMMYTQQSGTTSSNPFITVYSIRDPTTLDVNYPIQKRWVNFALVKEWILENFISTNGSPVAHWVLLTNGGSNVVSFTNNQTANTATPILGNIIISAPATQITLDTIGNTISLALVGGTGPAVQTLTGNTGGAVGPLAGNINIVGDGTTITITGNPGTNTLTASLVGGGTAVDNFILDSNNAVPTAAGNITINGVAVASGAAKPLRTVANPDAPNSNAFNINIQAADDFSSGVLNQAGIASFKNTDFIVDGTTGFTSLNPIAIPQTISNIGIAYSAGTFTVQGYNGAALSATNPGIVWLQDKAIPGRLRRYLVTANQTFTDGAAGSTDNQRFGLTTGVNASVNIPFFLYAVGNDAQDTIAFMIGRVPQYTLSPVAAKIGKVAAIVNTGQGDLFSLPNITVGDYDTNPCLLVGSFKMQFTGATDSWTVTALTNQDGIDQFQVGQVFLFPPGQFGAAAGKFFANNGGTAPDDTVGRAYGYSIDPNGFADVQCIFQSVNVPGAGAVNAIQSLPYASNGGILGQGYLLVGGNYACINAGAATAATNNQDTLIFTNNVANGLLQNASFSAGAQYDVKSYYLVSVA